MSGLQFRVFVPALLLNEADKRSPLSYDGQRASTEAFLVHAVPELPYRSMMLHPAGVLFDAPVGRSISPKDGSRALCARLVGQPLKHSVQEMGMANGQRRVANSR